MTSNGSGKNLLHMAHNGSSSIIEEEEEVESPGPLKANPSSHTPVEGDTSTTTLPNQSKEENKTVSYLALTKLGMGKKELGDSKLENKSDSNLVSEPKTKKTSPKEAKKTKEKNIKDGAEKEKKRSKPMISLLR